MTRGKEEGVVRKKRKDLPRPFASFPFPSPVVYFFGSRSISRAAKNKNLVFLDPFQRKCLRRRLQLVQLATHPGLG